MAAAPCKDCGRRPKSPGRHRCLVCQLRIEPIGMQVKAAQRRLAMVPPELRLSRRAGQKLAPAGTEFCASCQSYRDPADMGGSTQCKPCRSAKSHATSIEKTYGLKVEGYDELLERQGGKCAICRARPKSKRLAVDHDHKTGEVRGLLCSRCNHDLMGSAWDSMAMALALWHYMNTPPSTGKWTPPETGLSAPLSEATPSQPPAPTSFAQPGGAPRRAPAREDAAPATPAPGWSRPTGSISVPGKVGVWQLWVEPDAPPPF